MGEMNEEHGFGRKMRKRLTCERDIGFKKNTTYCILKTLKKCLQLRKFQSYRMAF